MNAGLRLKLLQAVAWLCAGVCAFAYWRSSFGDWATFERSIDFNQGSFEDYSAVYYRAGREIWERPTPVPGYYYSPTFALFLGALVRLQGQASVWTWLALELLAWVYLGWQGLRLARLERPLQVGLGVLLVVLSFPLVHNFHWGQTSTMLSALGLAGLSAWQRAQMGRAALCWALAGAIKFYPVSWLIPALLWWERRLLFYAILWLALLLYALPAVVLGPLSTQSFYVALLQELAQLSSSQGAWHSAANAQFFPAVVARFASPALAPYVRGLSWLVGAWVLLQLLRWLHRLYASRNEAQGLAFVLVCLALPFFVAPSWPHYFAYLPICQLYLARGLWAQPKDLRASLALSLIALSCICASLPFFRLFAVAEEYGRAGILLWANLALLPAAYLCVQDLTGAAWLARDRDQTQAAGRR